MARKRPLETRFLKPLRGGYPFIRFPAVNTWLSPCNPDRVVIPLCTISNRQVTQTGLATVKEGHFVREGDLIGRAGTYPVYASVTGRVTAIPLISLYDTHVPAVELAKESVLHLHVSTDRFQHHPATAEDTAKMHRDLIRLLSGSNLAPESVKHIIIPALSDEPVRYSLSALWNGYEQKIAGLISYTRSVYPNAQVNLVLDRKEKKLAEKIRVASNDLSGCIIYLIQNKYPHSDPRIIASYILNKPVSTDTMLNKQGMLTLDPAWLVTMSDMVDSGSALTKSIVAIFGPGTATRGFMRISIGTRIGDLLTHFNLDPSLHRVVEGGLLTGTVITDLSAPITHSTRAITVIPVSAKKDFISFIKPGRRSDSYTNCFLSALSRAPRQIDSLMHGGTRPCINCGYCPEVCPVDIYPNLLYKYITHGMLEDAHAINIMRCIDCGLCSYVCPSKLPLSSTMKFGKTQIFTQCAGLVKK